MWGRRETGNEAMPVPLLAPLSTECGSSVREWAHFHGHNQATFRQPPAATNMLHLQKPQVSGLALDSDTCPNWKVSLREKGNLSTWHQSQIKDKQGLWVLVQTQVPFLCSTGTKLRGLIATIHIPSDLTTPMLPQAAGGARQSPLWGVINPLKVQWQNLTLSL